MKEKQKDVKLETCALCGKHNCNLMLSHIIPKFVNRKMLKDSPSGYLRNVYDPNKREQDGIKEYLLCEDCEKLFNNWETIFANKVFHKFRNEAFQEITYEEWLNKFIVSVNWRILNLKIKEYSGILEYQKQIEEMEDDIYFEMRQAISYSVKIFRDKEIILREYLLEKRKNTEIIENNIFFCDEFIGGTDIEDFKEFLPNTFFRNTIFGSTYVTKDGAYVFSNLYGIIIVTILKKAVDDKWVNTQVHNIGKIEKTDNHEINSCLVNEFIRIMKNTEMYKKNISKHQQEQIFNNMLGKANRYIQSNLFKDITKDKEIVKKLK
ncbi:MAG: hypothetical protein AB9856_03015 [Cellulosilyticaceae bacterium]